MNRKIHLLIALAILFLYPINNISAKSINNLSTYKAQVDVSVNDEEIDSRINTALEYYKSENYYQSMFLLNRIYDVVQHSSNTNLKGDYFFLYGSIYERLDMHVESNGSYIKSLKAFENIDDEDGITKTSNKIRMYYEAIGQFDIAESIMNKYKHYKWKTYFSNDFSFKFNRGRNDVNSGQQYYNKLLQTLIDKNDSLGICYVYNGLGSLKYSDLNTNLKYLRKSLSIAKEIENKQAEFINYGDISVLYKDLRKYDSAVFYINESINIASHLSKSIGSNDLYKLQSTIYEEKGDTALAYSSLKKFMLGRVEYMRDENILYTKENELKKLEIKIEQQKSNSQQRLFFIIIISLFIIFTLIVLLSRQKSKAKLSKIIQEEKNIRFRTVIDTQENERKRIAQDLHDGLGQVLSVIKMYISELQDMIKPVEGSDEEDLISNSILLLDSSVEDVRSISHNLMPSALIKLGVISAIKEMALKINKTEQLIVSFNTNISKANLDDSVEIIVYRIIQEIVNNIIKHAEAENITIEVLEKGGVYFLQIKDDGKGFSNDDLTKGSGIGWKNIYSRIEMLNAEISINTSIGSGSEIIITFSPNN